MILMTVFYMTLKKSITKKLGFYHNSEEKKMRGKGIKH